VRYWAWAVTYIMQFLRVVHLSACLEAPSGFTNDHSHVPEASKDLVFIQKNWPFRLLWQKFYKPLQDKCRWELLLFISQFSLTYLGAAIVYPIFIALTTLFFASLFSLVNWLFLFFGISFYLFCFVYFGGTNDLLPMLHQQPRQAANCLYVLIRWDTGIPLTWW